MATSKKGALSMVPLDADNEDAQTYARNMADMSGALDFSEDSAKRDNWAAFGAGLTSPGDQAGALGRGMASELAQRNKEKTLRAQYVPLVMSAMTAKMQAQQAAQQQQVGAQLFATPLKEWTPEMVGIAKTMGIDAREIWELAKWGKNAAPGSTNLLPDSSEVTAPDMKTGMRMVNGKVVPIEGSAQVQGFNAAQERYGQNMGDAQFKTEQTMGPGNTPGTVPLASRLGVGTPNGPQPPQPQQFGLPAGAGAAPPQPGMQPPAPQPQGAPAAPGGGGGNVGVAGQGVQPVNGQSRPDGQPGGRPQVPQAVQGARNQGVVATLEAEMPKMLLQRETAMRDLQEAMQSNDPNRLQQAREAAARADQDVAGLSREIQQAGGKPPGSLQAPVQAPPQAAPQPLAQVPAAAAPAGPPGFNPTDMSTQTKAGVEVNKGLNTDWIANSYRPALTAAGAAKEQNTSIASMREAVSRMPDDAFGRFSEYKKTYAEMLAAMGVPNADKVATDYQQFQQAAQTQLWKTLNAASGPQTEGDAARAKETFAKLGNTKKANEFMMDFAQAANELAVKKADFYKDMVPYGQKQGNMSIIDNEWGKLGKEGKGLSVWDAPIMKRWKGK